MLRPGGVSGASLTLPRWFPLARRVYRFLDHPVRESARAAGPVLRFGLGVALALGLLLYVSL